MRLVSSGSEGGGSSCCGRTGPLAAAASPTPPPKNRKADWNFTRTHSMQGRAVPRSRPASLADELLTLEKLNLGMPSQAPPQEFQARVSDGRGGWLRSSNLYSGSLRGRVSYLSSKDRNRLQRAYNGNPASAPTGSQVQEAPLPGPSSERR